MEGELCEIQSSGLDLVIPLVTSNFLIVSILDQWNQTSKLERYYLGLTS